MKNSKYIVFVLAVIALSIIAVSTNAQRRSSRTTDRQVNVLLQRLEQSSNRFRGSLNIALILDHIDETRPQDDINTFNPALESAIDQFGARVAHRIAVAADVQNILQKASLVNGFMTRHRLSPQAQSDWASVRTDLNALAAAYGVSRQWTAQSAPASSSRSSRLSDSELNQLIRRIETDGNRFQSSLTDAFSLSRYDQTGREANVNQSVRDLKKATEQLRNRFDARQLIADDVQGVFQHAVPIDKYMRASQLTPGAQFDWSTFRTDLETLGGAYNISADWQWRLAANRIQFE